MLHSIPDIIQDQYPIPRSDKTLTLNRKAPGATPVPLVPAMIPAT